MKCLSLLFFFMCEIYNVNAIDVTYVVSLEMDDHPTSIDSMCFNNVSNGSRLIFKDLPEQESYTVNLTTQSIEFNTRISSLKGHETFEILKSIPGEVSFFCNTKGKSDVYLSVLNLNGACLYQSTIPRSEYESVISLQIPYIGIYILSLRSSLGNISEKIMGSNTFCSFNTKVTGNNSHGYTELRLKDSIIDYPSSVSFKSDDSLQVLVYRSRYRIEPKKFKVTKSDSIHFKVLKTDIFGKRLISLNFDDLPATDEIHTPTLLKKYGYTANFNHILAPFTSVSQREKRIKNVKELIRQGNEIGFHAIFGTTGFFLNPTADRSPEGFYSTFPTLEELTIERNSSGKNVFGFDLNTKIANIVQINTLYNGDTDFHIPDVLLKDLTEENRVEMANRVCLYSCPKLYYGLDEHEIRQGKTMLWWLEHWYNEMVDSSMGYSTNTPTDYSGTYPNGIFIKGFFKGCATNQNQEVWERLFVVHNAFVRKYYGVEQMKFFSPHGGNMFHHIKWVDGEGRNFHDRNLTLRDGPAQKYYSSLTGSSRSFHDAMLSCGFTSAATQWMDKNTGSLYAKNLMISTTNFTNMAYSKPMNQLHEDRMPYFSSFCNAFTKGTQSKEAWESYFNTETDPSKVLYDYKSSNGALSDYFYNYINYCINETERGRVWYLSIDTYQDYYSQWASLELLLEFLSKNDFAVAPPSITKEIVLRRDTIVDNWFPNPEFNQTIQDELGVITLPDGWTYESGKNNHGKCEIGNEIIDKKEYENFKSILLPAGSMPAQMMVYGIPTNQLYTFKCAAKGKGTIRIKKIRNNTPISMIYSGNGDTYEINVNNDEFEIVSKSVFVENADMLTNGEVNCLGYDEKVMALAITLIPEWIKGTSVSLALPELKIEQK